MWKIFFFKETNIALNTLFIAHKPYFTCFVLESGLYGHTAVYHEQTDAIYVFGGYRFHVESVEPSAELYSLYYPNLTWSLLATSQGIKVRSWKIQAVDIHPSTLER